MFNKRFLVPVLAISLMVGSLQSLAAENTEPQPITDISKAEHPKPLQQLQAHIYANYTGRKYILGPNDIISVHVYDTPEFTQDNILIQPDGNITMAPFGSISLAGKTMEQAQLEFSDRLKTYLNDPKVTIKLEHTKPFTVYVAGGVLRPGSYEMVTDVFRNQMVADNTPEILLERKSPLLSNVLVAAGGITYDADLEHVKITNKIDGSSYDVNLLDLIQQGDSNQDLFLVAGDSVFVPKLATPFAVSEEKYKVLKGATIFQKRVPVKVYGFVNKPGLIGLDSAQSANLNSAIAEAGGYLNENNNSASYAPKFVYVSRVDANGHLATRKVDPKHEDMTLMPNDIVYVPDKGRAQVGKAFDYITRVIMPVASMAGAFNNWALLFDPKRFNVTVTGR